jgi:hypothetical protein
MKKIVVIIGLIILIVGGIMMAGGYSTTTSQSAMIDECNSTTGQLKRLVDSEYESECQNAASTVAMGAFICFGGIPMLIVGIIILIVGLIMKGAPKPGAVPVPGQYPQQIPPYAPAPVYPNTPTQPPAYQPPQQPPAYQQPPPQAYGPPPQPPQYGQQYPPQYPPR